jgi:hypothetical protein
VGKNPDTSHGYFKKVYYKWRKVWQGTLLSLLQGREQEAGQREGCDLVLRHFFSGTVLGFELMVPCLLDRCSAIWAILLALFPFGVRSTDCTSPDLCLLST